MKNVQISGDDKSLITDVKWIIYKAHIGFLEHEWRAWKAPISENLLELYKYSLIELFFTSKTQ